MQETNSVHENIIYRFFFHPAVVISTYVATIISIPLAIYFYMNSTSYRDLVYLVHPAKATVVKAGQSSRLSVTLDGEPINKDVTAVQLALWNDGNASIKPEHLLQPLRVVTSQNARIIEGTVRKTSRDAIRLDLDTSRIDEGELGVSWNILEHGDGAILQIIFAGPPSTPISVNAVIEGQRAVRKVRSGPSETSGKKYLVDRTLFFYLAMFYIGLGIVVFVDGTRRYLRRGYEQQIEIPRSRLWRLFIVIGPIMMMGGIYILYLRPPEPPFGF